jgi:hypothetical protein
MTKQLKQNEHSEKESRIVKVRYDDTTGVIDFGIFVVRPDGKKARVLGGGAFEEQDLDRVAEELINLADNYEPLRHFEEIDEGEELYEPLEEIDEGEELYEPLEEIDEREELYEPLEEIDEGEEDE